MALDDIIDRILADARAQAAELRDEAARRAAALVAAGQDKARVRTEEALARAAAALTAERNSRLAEARLAARAETLALKRELVADVFTRVEQGLRRGEPGEYIEFLAALVTPAIAREPAAVVLGFEDLERIGPTFSVQVGAALSRRHPAWVFTISGEPGDFAAGLHVRAPGCVHNLSLAALVAERREAWELVVSKALFAA